MSLSLIDSYEYSYDHVCLATYEKDILDKDLPGSNWFTAFKRWWYNLFLLSYSDARVRLFYCSSHAVRMDRSKQYRLYLSNIHPLSKFRNIWESLIIHVILLNMAIFYHSTSGIYGELDWSVYFIGVILEIVIIFDIYINSRTGYINYEVRKIILGTRKILLHYGSTKLFAHVLSSIPLQSIMFIKYGKKISCTVCKTNKFVATLQLLSLFRLYRLFDATSYWDRERNTFKATYFLKFLRICVFGIATMLSMMKTSDTITFLIISNTGYVDDRSYFATIFAIKHGKVMFLSNLTFMGIELARTCKSFLLFSFSLKPQVYFLDKVVSLYSYLLAMVFYLWSLVECYVCIGRIKFPQHQIVTTVNTTMNLVKWRQLPDRFAAKLKKYYSFNMTKLKITEAENELYKSLPKSLKNDIILSSYTRLVKKVSCFSEWPDTLIDKIVLLLVEEIYLKGDVVAEASFTENGATIIEVGVLAVYSIDGEEKRHLIDGDYFGEMSLITDKEIRMSSVIALTSSKVVFLDKFAFRRLMKNHSQLFYDMKQQLVSKYNSSNRTNNNFSPQIITKK